MRLRTYPCAQCVYGRRVLHEFLSANRADLIDRCRSKVAKRRAPKATDAELEHGIPSFLDELAEMLRHEGMPGPVRNSGASARSEMRTTAARHGHELLQHGFTVDQVVHDYGDLCQAITDLAFEQDVPLAVNEFRTLNRCLDNAIADSVAEFSYRRDLVLEEAGVQALNERLGFLAHELRNLIQTATLALTAIKAGNAGVAGATAAVLDRSLIGLRNLVDRSLADVRVTAGMPPRFKSLSLAELIGELKISASLEAQARGCDFSVSPVDPALAVHVDRELLFSAISNLLQNAFKFTEQNTEVSLNVHATADRILIEVEDRCGGLPEGEAQRMFRPFTQGGNDRSGLGLGLSICRRSVEANNGILSVRDMPGSGCVFTIDLPRQSPAAQPAP